jgi:hypothetical protein
MDEYRATLASAVDAACDGDLQALLMAQWLLASLHARVATELSAATSVRTGRDSH